MYFNIASLGKSTENHYSIIAVDCNGIAIRTMDIGIWPAIVITAPLNKYLGGSENPYAYRVPDSAANPIRALVFDLNPPTQVQYRIGGAGNWLSMIKVPSNPYLWEASWDASSLFEGEYLIEVQASSASGSRTDVITVDVESEKGWGSAYEMLFDYPSQLQLLRRFRDSHLTRAFDGWLYTALLYANSKEALTLFLRHPDLLKEARHLIERNAGAIEAVLNGKAGTLFGTGEIAALIEKLAAKAPPGLRSLAMTVRSEMLRKWWQGEQFLGFWLYY